MKAKSIIPNLYVINLGKVNAFLLTASELTLIDTGYPGSEGKILQAVTALGHKPASIRHILLTHCHPDHAGSLAALQQATGATTYAHPLDAPAIRAGAVAKSLTPTPKLIQRLLFRLFIQGLSPNYPAAKVDREINDGEALPLAGGLRVLHTPGHSAGHVAFFWPQHGGVLLAGDTCANLPTLDYSPGYDDFAQGQRTLGKLTQLDFAAIGFGHGSAITKDATAKFRRRWRTLHQ
jgi:glyoxylase-like metal-dependent hydrolase (beta-lactamase superfamily II)